MTPFLVVPFFLYPAILLVTSVRANTLHIPISRSNVGFSLSEAADSIRAKYGYKTISSTLKRRQTSGVPIIDYVCPQTFS